MARTAITITELTPEATNAVVLGTAGVAIDATNDHSITPTGDIDVRELLLFVVHTTALEKDYTVVAGSNPPAVRAGLGDVVVPMADGSTTQTLSLFPLTGSRFQQSDGTIHVDIETGMTGRIACFRAPRSDS